METKVTTKTITVKTDEENPLPVEIIAEAIIKISDAFEKINKGNLSRRALLLLIHDNCGTAGYGHKKAKPTMKQIEEVLESVASLKKAYIKELKK